MKLHSKQERKDKKMDEKREKHYIVKKSLQ